MATAVLNAPTIGGRYILQEHLGTGGMGTVYHALDRLTGQAVALKQVNTPDSKIQFATQSQNTNLRVALAQEFQTLASLRHPHIVSVLDYGFDEDKQPYYTMTLLEEARTILEAAGERERPFQINLIIQLLQALDYLHQRGILHRDLKPGNVLVITNEVKVLDFGLSVSAVTDKSSNTSITTSNAGTFAYMAPELFLDSPPSQSADLYAVGLLLYELLAGDFPYNKKNMGVMINQILNEPVDVEALNLNKALTALLHRLLVKQPHKRYHDAGQVINDLCEATGHPLPRETVEIRDSYLQAATFVGRQEEMRQLTAELDRAIAGKGDAWLIGGESGVGKSRLADELRIQALVKGMLVLRGQAVQEGGSPYQIWRNSLRWLALMSDMSDEEASLLQLILPDMGKLLERNLPDVPAIDPQAVQARLLEVVTTLFQQLDQPVMLLLEDVQWIDSNALTLLNHLNEQVADWPVLIVGTYRDDDLPDLPRSLPSMNLLKLDRLTEKETAELSSSMLKLGRRGRQLVRLLQRETEGNPFFLVEVVRALAEEAGRLRSIETMTLPEHIFTGGLQNLVQRRLSRVPDEYRPLLQLAATDGRLLDLNILRQLHQTIDLEEWLTTCANSAVLEIQEDQWRFAHDKLREILLADLPLTEQQALHRQVAHAIEDAYTDVRIQAPRLAHHWHEAGDPHKIVHFAEMAGDQALNVGANAAAKTFFEQAIASLPHLPQTAENQERTIDITRKLARVAAFLPSDNILELLDQALELAQQLADEMREAYVRGAIGAYYYLRAQYSLAFANFSQSMALAEKLGLDELLVLPYNLIGRSIYISGDYPQAAAMMEKGITLAEKYYDPELLAGTLGFYAASLWNQGRMEEGSRVGQRALDLAEEIGHPSRIAGNLMTIGFAQMLCGYYDKAIDYLTRCLTISMEMEDLPTQYIPLGSLGYIYLQLGDVEQAAAYMDESLAISTAGGAQAMIHLPTFQSVQAELLLKNKQWEAAQRVAEEAVVLAEQTRQPVSQALAQQALARILMALPQGDLGRAEQLLRQSIKVHEGGNGRLPAAITQFDLIKLHMARRQHNEARTLVAQLIEIFTQYGMTWHLQQARQIQQQI